MILIGSWNATPALDKMEPIKIVSSFYFLLVRPSDLFPFLRLLYKQLSYTFSLFLVNKYFILSYHNFLPFNLR